MSIGSDVAIQKGYEHYTFHNYTKIRLDYTSWPGILIKNMLRYYLNLANFYN